MARGTIIAFPDENGHLVADPSAQTDTSPDHVDLPRQTPLQDAIHEKHQSTRDRTIQVLARSPLERLQNQALRMAGCGSYVDFAVDADNELIRRLTHRCKSRFCPFCQRQRGKDLAAKIERLILLMENPRTIVLTVKSEELPLKEHFHKLSKWFAQLRKHPDVKKHIINGVYTREATVNKRTGKFHPHLHIIYDGDYLAQKQLRRIWHTITGGSDIVWIQAVKNPLKMARELATYVIKPADADSWLDSTLESFAAAVHGMQMMHTFGKKFARDPYAEKRASLPREKLPTFSLTQLAWQARNDNADAVAMLLLIAQRWPDLGRYVFHQFPQLHVDADDAPGQASKTPAQPPSRGPPGDHADELERRQKLEMAMLHHFARLNDEAIQRAQIRLPDLPADTSAPLFSQSDKVA